jgi:hypothetical protein
MFCIPTSTTVGSWPSTLRLPGLTTHKSPAYKNLAHQPIKHNYNSFQNMVYNGARPWGHYTNKNLWEIHPAKEEGSHPRRGCCMPLGELDNRYRGARGFG